MIEEPSFAEIIYKIFINYITKIWSQQYRNILSIYLKLFNVKMQFPDLIYHVNYNYIYNWSNLLKKKILRDLNHAWTQE